MNADSIMEKLLSVKGNKPGKLVDLKEEETLLTSEEAVLRADKFFDDFSILAASQDLNEDGTTKCPYTDYELEAKIKEEFKRLTSSYYCSVEAKPKRVISSYLMSAFSIAGITYMPNVEPCYNTQMLSQDIAITCAHEIAHTKGIMRENDANEVAYYILLTSSDNYLRYVGYLKTMAYMNRVYKLNNIDVGVTKIPACAIADYRASRQFWDEKGVMEKVGDAINSLYLKLNSQTGTDSYNSYDNYESETIIDENGEEKDVYTVKSYSHVQNMIFALYQ